ncbi:MAG: ATP-dependent Clp protease ATP-binding subunit [bacterium]|nr:ATP-dependent Clp protease ATP-binding subunit [bacterium]
MSAMSIPNKFTAHLRHILQRAGAFATMQEAAAIRPAHLLLALTLERGSLGAEILSKMRVRADAVSSALGITDTTASGDTELRKLSPGAKRALEKAALAASAHEHRYIGSEHLLTGVLETEDPEIAAVLSSLHLDPAAIVQHLANVLKSTSKFPDFTAAITDPQELMAEAETQAEEGSGAQKTPALDFFAKDLTNPETILTIDPVVGRDAEIERVIQILCRRTKNNPILVGDPGVGKTAIVEGLARRIVERDVPDILVGKRILSLDLALLVAGTIYRGEFESRLKQILDEVRQDRNLILFIDEIHTIMGAGAASGSLDAANILKPALARGDIRCVGATTYDEFKKHVENDAALERRFQQVHVKEPSTEETRKILQGLKPYYEQFHRVTITESAMDAAVALAERYVTDRRFPDKAIDLLDEASARVRVQAKNNPLIRRASAIDARLALIDGEKRQAVSDDRYDDASALQREYLKITKELAQINEQLKQHSTAQVGDITERDVAAVVAAAVGIPLEELLLEEHERFLRIGDALRNRIVGQEAAVTAVAHALQRAKSGLAAPNRPLASFLFLGPTGVGKTETAKALAELLYQRNDALIRLDMSEFSEGFTISKLIGAPAGYVGYREGSKLTDEIRKRPASVVLFDEIEKAHPDVWNLLLQILEDGRLTDATGREARFTNAIIILTSNVGAGAFTKANIGFLDGADATEALSRQYADIKTDAIAALRSRFRPELLNRIDETVVYRPLGREHLATIARYDTATFAARLEREHRMHLIVDDAAYDWFAARAFDPAQGARAIRRLLHEHLENAIAQGILEERFVSDDTIRVSVMPDGNALNVAKRTHGATVTRAPKKREKEHA